MDGIGARSGPGAAGLLLMLAACGPAAAGDIAVITSQNAGEVTVMDAGTGRIRGRIPVPGDPVSVAVDGQGRAYVVAVKSRMLHVISPAGQEIARHPLPGAPFGIALAPAGAGPLFISDWGGFVHELDPETGRVIRSLPAGGNPSGLATDGRWLVVAERDADRLVIHDLTGGADPVAVPVGQHPFGVTLRDGRAYAADVLSDTVSVVDLAAARAIATIPTGERPYAVAFAGGRGFVTNQYGGSVTVFDAASLAPVATVPVGDYPEGIAATPDGRAVLVANWMSDSVTRIDAATLAADDGTPMPGGPRAFGSFTGRSDD